MGKTMSSLDFRLMALSFRFRDFFSPRKNILKEVGIQPGFFVLDYGCGPGSYIVPLTELVGKSGKVYALDRHPLSLKSVKKIAMNRHLMNVETIHSDCHTRLPDSSLDVVLVYDTFHDLNHTESVLKELHRILKPHGILSLTDHHMSDQEIMSGLTEKGFFTLAGKGKKTYTFSKKRITL